MFSNRADPLTSLPPPDVKEPSQEEKQLLDSLFVQKLGIIQNVLMKTKDVLIIGLLYVIFSLPQLDPLIIKFIPRAEKSLVILLGVKTVLFMVVYFLIKNWYLVKRLK